MVGVAYTLFARAMYRQQLAALQREMAAEAAHSQHRQQPLPPPAPAADTPRCAAVSIAQRSLCPTQHGWTLERAPIRFFWCYQEVACHTRSLRSLFSFELLHESACLPLMSGRVCGVALRRVGSNDDISPARAHADVVTLAFLIRHRTLAEGNHNAAQIPVGTAEAAYHVPAPAQDDGAGQAPGVVVAASEAALTHSAGADGAAGPAQ